MLAKCVKLYLNTDGNNLYHSLKFKRVLCLTLFICSSFFVENTLAVSLLQLFLLVLLCLFLL